MNKRISWLLFSIITIFHKTLPVQSFFHRILSTSKTIQSQRVLFFKKLYNAQSIINKGKYVWKKPFACSIFLSTGLGLGYKYYKYDTQKLISKNKLLSLASNVAYSGIPLNISQEILKNIKNINDLKKILIKNGLNDKYSNDDFEKNKKKYNWDNKTLLRTYKIFKESKNETNKKHDSEDTISLSHCPEFLARTKNILQSLLLQDEQVVHIDACSTEMTQFRSKGKDNAKYIQKYGIHRILTYANLQHIINDKKFKHVRLPQKNIAIFDNENNRYVPYHQAYKLLSGNDVVVMVLNGDRIYLREISKKYAIRVFATFEEGNSYGFNKPAMDNLRKLIDAKGEFDVGHSNIISSSNGDAIIIDTENKGPDFFKEKLRRYSEL